MNCDICVEYKLNSKLYREMIKDLIELGEEIEQYENKLEKEDKYYDEHIKGCCCYSNNY